MAARKAIPQVSLDQQRLLRRQLARRISGQKVPYILTAANGLDLKVDRRSLGLHPLPHVIGGTSQSGCSRLVCLDSPNRIVKMNVTIASLLRHSLPLPLA
jgi:hypothetical protein